MSVLGGTLGSTPGTGWGNPKFAGTQPIPSLLVRTPTGKPGLGKKDNAFRVNAITIAAVTNHAVTAIAVDAILLVHA